MIVAQFAIEPLPVLDGIIIGHQVVSNCQRRLPYHPRCLDLDCIECDGIFVDLTFLWSLNVAPMLARALFKILPIKTSSRDKILKKFGNITPDDVDWDRLDRGYSKLKFILTKIGFLNSANET